MGWGPPESSPTLNVDSLTPEKLHGLAHKVEAWQTTIAKAVELLPLTESFNQQAQEELLVEILQLDVAELHGWAELLESGKATWSEEVSQTP